jgi:hypothetical protein
MTTASSPPTAAAAMPPPRTIPPPPPGRAATSPTGITTPVSGEIPDPPPLSLSLSPPSLRGSRPRPVRSGVGWWSSVLSSSSSSSQENYNLDECSAGLKYWNFLQGRGVKFEHDGWWWWRGRRSGGRRRLHICGAGGWVSAGSASPWAAALRAPRARAPPVIACPRAP